jgi:hypothetical protein
LASRFSWATRAALNHRERLSKEKSGTTSRGRERFSYEDWRCRSEKDSTRSEHRVQQRMFSEGCRVLQRHPITVLSVCIRSRN